MLLIKNGKILTMAGVTYDSGCVLINNGKIENVAEHIEVKQDIPEIDARGCWVMLPGCARWMPLIQWIRRSIMR